MIQRLGVAQFGSVLEWGSRGRKFESSHPDHNWTPILIRWVSRLVSSLFTKVLCLQAFSYIVLFNIVRFIENQDARCGVFCILPPLPFRESSVRLFLRKSCRNIHIYVIYYFLRNEQYKPYFSKEVKLTDGNC